MNRSEIEAVTDAARVAGIPFGIILGGVVFAAVIVWCALGNRP